MSKEYLGIISGFEMNFITIKTYHAILRGKERDLPLVEESDVFNKVKEAISQIEKSWLEINGGPEFFKRPFSGWIHSESLKLNIIIDVRLDTQTFKPAIIIVTAVVKSEFVPKGRDIEYRVSVRKEPAMLMRGILLASSALIACDSNKELEKLLMEDITYRNLQRDVSENQIVQYFGKDGLTYCVEKRADNHFYVVDINFINDVPEVIIRVG